MIQISKDIKIQDVSNIINKKSPSVSGIVNQDCKGKLWVDDIDKPRIAVTESFATGSFAILGIYETKEDFIRLKDFLENDLFRQLKTDGYKCFEFSIDSENMRENILEMFKDRTILTEKEYSFRVNLVPKNNSIPHGYQLKKIDNTFWNLLLEGNFENEDLIKTRLLESWHSFDEFMNKSLGYCITFNKRIVAEMIGTASFQNIVAIDIETEENHKGLGLAYNMAVEFIADCLRNDYIPQWDCVESNPKSYNLATKLGFEKINEGIVYWFDI